MAARARAIYYDVTRPIRAGMPVYPGDPAVAVEAVATVAGDGYAVAHLALGTHTGTHLDPPAHFIEGGLTVDQAPLDLLIGQARVVRVEGARSIGRAALQAEALAGVERVLFQTRRDPTEEGDLAGGAWVYLEPEAARMLAEGGTRLVGIDTFSVDPPEPGAVSAHVELLGRGVWILERLELSAVPPGDYDLFCLPLKIAGGDGAPARVVLRARGRCAAGGP
jgi:arylformamidase